MPAFNLTHLTQRQQLQERRHLKAARLPGRVLRLPTRPDRRRPERHRTSSDPQHRLQLATGHPTCRQDRAGRESASAVSAANYAPGVPVAHVVTGLNFPEISPRAGACRRRRWWTVVADRSGVVSSLRPPMSCGNRPPGPRGSQCPGGFRARRAANVVCPSCRCSPRPPRRWLASTAATAAGVSAATFALQRRYSSRLLRVATGRTSLRMLAGACCGQLWCASPRAARYCPLSHG